MAATKTYRRAAELAPGIGPNLTDILDKDVVVSHVSISERSFEGEPRPIVLVTVRDNDGGEVTYHAWSESLADKISQIPEDQFPLMFKFIKVPTRKYPTGVITFE